jgi:transcriptional regulator NrdR family protein
MAVDIIKRGGERKTERFDSTKLHASVLAACLSVRSPEGEAESVAQTVAERVTEWCSSKPAATSSDIRRVAAEFLDHLHPDAAYLYQNHHLVI